jgi:hypothetical protein
MAEPASPPAAAPAPPPADASAPWPELPTETDIYILPDGRVVIADLPAELTALAAALGAVEPCEIAPDAQLDSPL